MTLFMEENLEMPLYKVLNIVQSSILDKSSYFGIPTQKSPMDAWIYQEIIFETKPNVIIEIGNAMGGSTLLLAHICDLIGNGKIIGIDISQNKIPQIVRDHPRITLIEGDACENFQMVERLLPKNERVLVIEDSSHTFENTLDVLRLYSKLIMPGDYFIIEDSICHHGLDVGPTPGPYEAIEIFVNENDDFVIDRDREQYLITWNPKGYLRRVAKGLKSIELNKTNKVKNRLSNREILRLFIPPIFYHGIRKFSRGK
jgi:cephalosporin hydroxylase